MIKGFVITKIGDSVSETMAENCIQSGKNYGFDIEKFAGIYENFDQLIADENLFSNPEASKHLRHIGVFGCFLSHYFLWKKCIELNIPLAIFEYDAEIFNSLPINFLELFEDYLNLDYARHLYLNNNKGAYIDSQLKSEKIEIAKYNPPVPKGSGYKFMNRTHIRGAFGYVIKPSGAIKIIKGIKSEGIIPADVAPNLKYTKLYYTTPSVVRLNSLMVEKRKELSHTNK